MSEKLVDISAYEFVSVVVYRASGNQIQSITTFKTLAEAIDHVNATPQGLAWSMQFNLEFRRTFPMYRHNDRVNAVFSTDGPGYVGCFYD